MSSPTGTLLEIPVHWRRYERQRSRTVRAALGGTRYATPPGERPEPGEETQERVAAFQSGFVALIRGFAATALEQHELPASDDPDRLAFELNGIILATNASFVPHDDPIVLDLARQVVHQRLGLGNGRSPGES